jgi:hypothetical protein
MRGCEKRRTAEAALYILCFLRVRGARSAREISASEAQVVNRGEVVLGAVSFSSGAAVRHRRFRLSTLR